MKILFVSSSEPQLVWSSIRIAELLPRAVTVPAEIPWSEYVSDGVVPLLHHPN